MKPAGIAQMYPKNALGALGAISGGKGAGANVNKKRFLSFGTEEYVECARDVCVPCCAFMFGCVIGWGVGPARPTSLE
eukprot:4058182-Prymnesium_polylepis.1